MKMKKKMRMEMEIDKGNAMDPAIKLFGLQISVSAADDVEQTQKQDDFGHYREEEEEKEDQIKINPETRHDSENPETPSINEEATKTSELNCKPDSVENQKAALKKPDKILPCRRCNSMETKFCYYNNYNPNQPRHFCKGCQRYWTAGGTMRNVPVGAGRRKSKSSSSHNHRHITISEALQAVRIDVPNGTYDTAEFPHSEKVLNVTRNSFHSIDGKNHENSVHVSNSIKQGEMDTIEEQALMYNLNNGLAPEVPCLAWPYPWSFPAVPGIYPLVPGFGIPYYGPVEFLSGTCGSRSWNVANPIPQEEMAQTAGSDSRTLGKHSREENEHPETENGRVLAPKILRVHNPSEAAKSTIWSTLGIKNETASGKGGAFHAFQSKGEGKNRSPKASHVLCANPAALSRSIKFHESS